jgi:ubiquitin-large subunit ribosomal protein L40e
MKTTNSSNNDDSFQLDDNSTMHLSQRIRSGSICDNESSMTIFVVDKDSHLLFGVDNTETVQSLKSKIADRRGIPFEQQRLVFAGKQLEDSNRLSDYNIRAQSCIQLV